MDKLRMLPGEPSLDLQPLSARSIVLSVLLGSHPPEMPVALLLDFTALFGIPDGTIRTALSRMSSSGELEGTDGVYRLSGRLLDRQLQQDTGRTTPPTEWNGQWWIAVVLSERRSMADRRSFRSRVRGARFGELRPDTWMRPANIEVPTDLPDVVMTRGELTTGDAVNLVQTLWDTDALDQQALQLRTHLNRVEATLRSADRSDGALASAFTVLAACLRYLRTEPQLPTELAVGTAANDLRSRYDDAVHTFQEQLAAFFQRRGLSRAAPSADDGSRQFAGRLGP